MPPSYKRAKIEEEEICVNNNKPSSSKGNNEDWREKAISFKERHSHALKQGILTDVSFSVGCEKKIISAHKMILALASPVFEVMFYGSLKETGDIIHIPDLVPSGFQLLVDYIYSDNMEIKSDIDALHAWFAADKYCLPHMRDACCNYLSQCELTLDNIWLILESSTFLNSPSLTDRCLNYVRKNIEEAMTTPRFLDVRSETLKKILALDSMFVSEVSLLEGVVRWSEEKVKAEESTLQQFLEPYLRYIRFGCMSQKDFVGFIDEHTNIISDSDALAILKYMTDSRVYSLPEWCSHNVYPRKAIDKRQGSIKRMTLSIRSYAIKPHPTPRSDDLVDYHHESNSHLLHDLRNERVPMYRPLDADGPSRGLEDDNDSRYYSSSDEDDVENASRRNVGASNVDSDDTSSTYSSSSSDTAQSFSS